MRTLVVSATFLEVKDLPSLKGQVAGPGEIIQLTNNCDLLICGIGGVATTYNLSKYLRESKYDLVLNIGLAGSFNAKYKTGCLVNVEKDCFADLGAENDGNLLSIFDLKLEKPDSPPFEEGWLINKSKFFKELPKVKGITVNTTTGSSVTLQILMNKYNPDIETMEGAAVAYTCILEKIPFIQIRAISNYVGERDKQKWNIRPALNKLHLAIEKFIENEE